PYFVVPVGVREPAALLRAPAPRLVVRLGVRDVHELWLFLAAHIAPVLATRFEPAAGRRRDQVRRETLDGYELGLAPLVEARDRTQEAPRVGHLRICEELPRVGLLDDLAAVHDVNALGHAGDHAEVVSDEDEGRPELP